MCDSAKEQDWSAAKFSWTEVHLFTQTLYNCVWMLKCNLSSHGPMAALGRPDRQASMPSSWWWAPPNAITKILHCQSNDFNRRTPTTEERHGNLILLPLKARRPPQGVPRLPARSPSAFQTNKSICFPMLPHGSGSVDGPTWSPSWTSKLYSF